MSSITYRPELDGLRAVAVIPVILFHLLPSAMPGGFIGVDIFFVISGFLITSIIIDEIHTEKFAFRNFWARRIRRILPALITMVVTAAAAAIFILDESEFHFIGHHGIAALLSYANFSHWLSATDYWGFSSESSPFLHAWSLSVEEQFYLLFPVVLFLFAKYSRQNLVVFFFIITLISLAIFLYGSQKDSLATFYLLPTRIWELGSGALLALYAFDRKSPITHNTLLSATGLLFIIASLMLMNKENGTSAYLLLPVLGTTLFIAFSNGPNPVSKLLTHSVIRYTGKISYSLYLWHWPVIILAGKLSVYKNIDISPFVLVLLVVVLSITSYHLIETPARRNPKSVPYILASLVISIALLLLLANHENKTRLEGFNTTEYFGQLYDVSPRHGISAAEKRKSQGIKIIKKPVSNRSAYKTGGVIKLYGKQTPEVVVLGNSHALMWGHTLDQIARELGVSIAFIAANNTPLFFDIPPVKNKPAPLFNAQEKYEYDMARLAFLTQWKPAVVILSTAWPGYYPSVHQTTLLNFITNLGSTVVFLESPPALFFGELNAPVLLAKMGIKPKKNAKVYIPHKEFEHINEGNKLRDELIAACKNCLLIPTQDIYLNENHSGVLVLDSNSFLYTDFQHLSEAGAQKSKMRIKSYLQKILERKSSP